MRFYNRPEFIIPVIVGLCFGWTLACIQFGYNAGHQKGLCQGWADTAGLVAGVDDEGNCLHGSYPATETDVIVITDTEEDTSL